MIIPASNSITANVTTTRTILIQNQNFSILIAFVSILITILAIWIAHIITERYTVHKLPVKNYIEWLHGLNQRYYLKMADYMDNLSKTLEEYRFFLEAFIRDERTEKALIWSFYLICSFVKLFKKLNDEVGDLRLFNFQKAHVDVLTIRRLNYFLIELFKEFMDVKYVEEVINIRTYTHFEQEWLKSDDALKQSFENFKHWIKDYNNLNSLINLSRLYSDVLLMAVMQTYPLSGPLSVKGCLSRIKLKIFRKDTTLENVVGINPKETIKKAKNLVKYLEERENLIKNIRLLLKSLSNNQNYVDTTEEITVFEEEKLKQLGYESYHVKPKIRHIEIARYVLKSDDDMTTALRNTANLYLKLYNNDRLKLPFDLRCFWCYGLDHEIYITETPNNDKIDEWISFVERRVGKDVSCIILSDKLEKSTKDKYNKSFGDENVLLKSLNLNDKDELIKIIEFIRNARKNDKEVVIQSSNGICSLVISAYLVYVVGMTKEDALELVMKYGICPFYKDDIRSTISTINILKTIEEESRIKRLSQALPM